MNHPWTAKQIANLSGKTVVITGASSGIGYKTALTLAGKGAEVVMAVRNEQKGESAAEAIRKQYPSANVKLMQVDLSDLNSINQFAEAYRQKYHSLSILINNAGVMIPPYQITRDGFELQFGSNHLGHFALTGLLMPVLLTTPESRIVTLSSLAAKRGQIDFTNLNGAQGYRPVKFYCQSKLANLLFAKELQNRFEAAGIQTMSIACHPGITHTNLMSRGTGDEVKGVVKLVSRLLFQSADMGALPSLYAATRPSLRGGEYIGPDGKGGRRGYPTLDSAVHTLFDEEVAKQLWEVSESLTGVRYSFASTKRVFAADMEVKEHKYGQQLRF